MKESEAKPPDKKEETKRQSRGINVELLEHRINELVKDTEEIKKEIKEIGKNVISIKVNTKHMASRSWVLGGALIAAGVAAGIIVSILKLWPPNSSADQELMKIILELVKKG